MTRKAAKFWVGSLWIVPNLTLFAYFASIENQGFQVGFSTKLSRTSSFLAIISLHCSEINKGLFDWKSYRCQTDFIQEIKFRGQYASFFFAPLFFMILIYAHIYVIVRRNQSNRQALTQENTVSARSRKQSQSLQSIQSTTVPTSISRSKILRQHSSVSRSLSRSSSDARTSSDSFVRQPHHNNANASLSSQSNSNVEQNNNAVKRNVKVTNIIFFHSFMSIILDVLKSN